MIKVASVLMFYSIRVQRVKGASSWPTRQSHSSFWSCMTVSNGV